MSSFSAVQPGRHAFSERGLDLYETPAIAVESLLTAEQLPYAIWEPAAGRNAITTVLRDAGHRVIASDIADYGEPLQCRGGLFLLCPSAGAASAAEATGGLIQGNSLKR